MRQLVIMAKKPVAGHVKSRLGKDIGYGRAVGIYRQLMAATIRTLSADTRWHTSLAIAPDTAISDPIWPINIEKFGQGVGDIGTRMQTIFNTAPCGPVIIIGTDIPHITRQDIADAFAQLGRCDVVFGPAGDGGFWLVGSRQSPRVRQMFSNVRWSGPHALSDCQQNVTHLKTGVAAERFDIDTKEDLLRWKSLKG